MSSGLDDIEQWTNMAAKDDESDDTDIKPFIVRRMSNKRNDKCNTQIAIAPEVENKVDNNLTPSQQLIKTKSPSKFSKSKISLKTNPEIISNRY